MLDALAATPLPTEPGSPVIAMVSGGSDSTALLAMAAAGLLNLLDGRGPRPVEPEGLVCLHVNHSIRGEEADLDEEFVEGLCDRLGVPFHSARVDAPGQAAREGASSLEDVARRLRYREAWELARRLSARAGRDVRTSRLLVAHTADDRAETFLMRAMGGAGLAGMTGMRARRGLVLRPLLRCTRQELRDWLLVQGLGWREDSTNEEDRALRSYVRHHVTPAMRDRAPGFAQVLGRSLDLMGDDADLLDRLAHALLDRAVRPGAPADEEYAHARRRDGAPGDEEGAAPSPVPDPPRDLLLDARLLAGAEPALARRAVLQALRRSLGEERAWEVRLESAHSERVLDLARRGQGEVAMPLDTRVSCVDGVVLIHPRGAAPLPRLRSQPDPDADSPAIPAPVSLPVPGSARLGAWELRADLFEVPSGADPDSLARELAGRTAREMSAAVPPDARPDGGALPGARPDDGAPREGRDFLLLDAETCGVACGAAAPDEFGAAASSGPLVVHGALPGMRMRPWGMGGHSKLVSDLLMEAGVPAGRRAGWPVVCKLPAPASATAPGGAPSAPAPTDESAPAATSSPSATGKPPAPASGEAPDPGELLPDPGDVVFLAGIRAAQGPAYGPETRVLLRLRITFGAGSGAVRPTL